MPEEIEDSAAPRRPATRLLGTLALAGASSALCLGALEVGFRLAGYQPIHAVYSEPSILWRHDPALGWSHEPGASELYVGPVPFPIEYRTPVRINSLGLRGPEPLPLSPDGYRILLLGDSLVAGFEVAFEHTFGWLLQQQLERELGFPVQVVNAGVRGYGTDQVYLYYLERGAALGAELVVYLQSLNDATDNVTLHRMRRPFGKAAFALLGGGGLELRGHPIPRYPLCSAVVLDASFEPVRIDGARARALCWIQTRLSDHSAFFTWVALVLQQRPDLIRRLQGLGSGDLAGHPAAGALAGVGAPIPALIRAAAELGADPALAPRYALTSALVLELARAVRREGARFVWVVERTQWEQMDGAALERQGVAPHFLEVGGGRWNPSRAIRFRNDDHLNEAGHQLMARSLAELLAPIVRVSRGARPRPGPGGPGPGEARATPLRSPAAHCARPPSACGGCPGSSCYRRITAAIASTLPADARR